MNFRAFSIGHRLPFGFYGRAYFGSTSRPRYRQQFDEATLAPGGSAPTNDLGSVVVNLAIFAGAIWLWFEIFTHWK